MVTKSLGADDLTAQLLSTKLKRNLIHVSDFASIKLFSVVQYLVSCQKLPNSTHLRKDYKATSLAAEIHLSNDDEICHHVITFLNHMDEINSTSASNGMKTKPFWQTLKDQGLNWRAGSRHTQESVMLDGCGIQIQKVMSERVVLKNILWNYNTCKCVGKFTLFYCTLPVTGFGLRGFCLLASLSPKSLTSSCNSGNHLDSKIQKGIRKSI